MNAKEAIEYLETPLPKIGILTKEKARGFLEATQAAAPLLGEISKLQKALKMHERCGLKDGCKDCEPFLSSSASVVEKYRKETLGEI